MEGVKKRCLDSSVSECEDAGGSVGWGMVFLDEVGWTHSMGIKREELGVGQVYPVRGAKEVESVASTGEGTVVRGLVAYNENTGR